jgi:hypothetical protein
LSWGVILVLALGLVTKASAGMRTICYLPFANYQINYTGNVFQSKQVIFLGTVRCTMCDDTQSVSFQGQIQVQFTGHIESLYGSRLGVRHEWQERLGYWRWDSPEELLGMHQRIAARYPNIVHVDTFYYNCAASTAFFNIAGAYTCQVYCAAGGEGAVARIEQQGNALLFINEKGGRSSGSFVGVSTVVANDWGGLRATVHQGGEELRWANGTVWRRSLNEDTTRCEHYASMAVAQYQQNLANRCGFTGARWSDNYQGHYGWCLTASQAFADSETQARVDGLNKCTKTNPRCEHYARTAVAQYQQNLARRCGYTGARWSDNYQGHYGWCLTASQAFADSETQARVDGLNKCMSSTSP